MNTNSTHSRATRAMRFVLFLSLLCVACSFCGKTDAVPQTPKQRTAPPDTLRVTMTGESKDNPLLIVDGEERPYEEIKTLTNVTSLTSMPDSAAVEKYGEKGRYGAIIITTK